MSSEKSTFFVKKYCVFLLLKQYFNIKKQTLNYNFVIHYKATLKCKKENRQLGAESSLF